MIGAWRWFKGSRGDVRLQRGLLVAWIVLTPLAVAFGWIYSVAFVSVCSLYANIVAHSASLNAAKAGLQQEAS